MRDLWGRELQGLRGAGDLMEEVLARAGYQPLETPLLEETDLFVRKSGGELTSRLYTFTEPGGHRVSLRPEFTSSVIRHFVERQDDLSPPLRWRYRGPVFRYEPGPQGGYRQFTQVGAELVGAAGPEADAEVIGLAWECLRRAGVSPLGLRLGHVGLLNGLMDQLGLSETARLFVLGNAPSLRSGEVARGELLARAQEMGLLRPFSRGGADLLDRVGEEAARELVLGVLHETASSPLGSRSPHQIVHRLLRKMREADAPERLEEALETVGRLSALEGPPRRVLEEAAGIVGSRGPATASLEELGRLVGRLEDDLKDVRMTVDLGLARGISYYTGAIFELLGPSGSLGGGGRYDGLVKALGGRGEVPAMGFALTLDRVAEALSP